jgi:hypothetical protein
MSDSEDQHARSLADRARSVLSSVGQDDRVKQAAAVTKGVASRAGDASKSVSRKISQEDAWNELRGDVELLTEIARADHALVLDLLDRVAKLEARAASQRGSGHDS